MLTTDLVRATTRNGRLHPGYIKPTSKTWLEVAEQLVAAFEDHVGQRAGELTGTLRDIEGMTPRFKVTRGLAQVLYKRTEIDVDSPVDPGALREAVFGLAAARHPVVGVDGDATRRQILKEVAATFETTPEVIERTLYADLKDAQRVLGFKTMTPPEVLSRYNLALAQSILLRATSLDIVIHEEGKLAAARYRQLFRYLKFFQLLHRVEPRDGGRKGYRVRVDGPMSLFRHSGRYGFQMACFLPALVLCKGWKLKADVKWGPKKVSRTFELSPEQGLTSHFKARGVYLTEEQQMFQDRLQSSADEWDVQLDETLLPLGGQGLWIPDFKIRHREDNREAFVEVIGYWRADYLKRRLKLLAEHGPSNLILAISDKMQVDKSTVDELPVEVLWFKRVVRPKAILEMLSRVAVAPEA